MKKNFVYFILILIVVVTFFYVRNSKNTNKTKTINKQEKNYILGLTYDYSQEYLKLRYDTTNVLIQAKKYKNYNEWNNEVTSLLYRWKQMENHADFLNKATSKYIEPKSAFNYHMTNKALAYDHQEISNIFDKAPAGKKIKTLAKFLGVDSKRAYKILQNDQEMVKADAWNEAGDTFQKLETSAIAIKDGCKIAGYVGGVVLSGGAAGIAEASMLTKATLIVNGADLVLEVSDDSAVIALGNQNKISVIAGKIRKITEPASSILAITDMPNNLASKFDKFNAIMFGTDQLRSVAQEGKIIGINIISNHQKSVEAMVLTKQEAKEWLKNKGGDKTPTSIQEIFDALDKNSIEKKQENLKKEEKKKKQEKIEQKIENQSQSNNYVPEKVYSKNGKTFIAIIKSSATSFLSGQSQPWKAEIKNYDSIKQGQPNCSWKFFLNGKQVWKQNNTCFFTASVVPNSQEGELRAELTVKFVKKHYGKKTTEETLETIKAERFYKIKTSL